ncbi:MAG: hypothetical protein IJY04_04010, partial [Clostridia bacterium]|nr:hypothetical protein [Clostridia bacterium]
TYESLPTPVNHHPDMLFFSPPSEKITVLPRSYHTVNPRFFDKFPTAKLILSETALTAEYPHDIAFDAIGINDTLYCLEAYTAEEIKRSFPRTVNIKQGYAACSTLILNEKAAVTADKGIAKALRADGMTVLTVSGNGIALPGYNCGFIGGASAVINGTTVFFGSLTDHPDKAEIVEFYRVNDAEFIDFPNLPLTDYGGIRYLYVD